MLALYECFSKIIENKLLFHASSVQGIKVLEPSVSTHGKSWVYAAEHKHVAALFIGDWYDNDLSVSGLGSFWVPLTITEQYPGAFTKAFKGKSGSIYTIYSAGFTAKTGWGAELVSPLKTDVIAEEKIDDIENYLQNLISLGHIKLNKYIEEEQRLSSKSAWSCCF